MKVLDYRGVVLVQIKGLSSLSGQRKAGTEQVYMILSTDFPAEIRLPFLQ